MRTALILLPLLTSSLQLNLIQQLQRRFPRVGYGPPPVQRSSTPRSVFQYDNNTNLDINNTGYIMTLMLLGALGAAAFGVLAFSSTTNRRSSDGRGLEVAAERVLQSGPGL